MSEVTGNTTGVVTEAAQTAAPAMTATERQTGSTGYKSYQQREEEDTRLIKIGVIGTGNAGCMMANDACEKLGIDGVAINGSKRDLDLVSCPRVAKMLVGDGKGTGKDRKRAKAFFFEDSGLVLDKKFTSVVEDNDVIVIVTSTGGGYGSGSSTELAELLAKLYDNKAIIVAGVLPFNTEGSAAFEGTKAWLRELRELKATYMIYDNNRFMGIPKMTPNKAAAMVNEAFVHDLSVMQGDYVKMTRTGGIDERDMLTVLSAHGRIVVDSMDNMEVSNLVDGSIIATLKHHIDNESAHAEMVGDKLITASALMYALGDTFDEYKGAMKSEFQDTFGVHIKDTSNFSDVDEESMAVILSGLTEPVMVIDRIINAAKKMENDIISRRAATSKLDKADEGSKLQDVVAKQSFADEKNVAGGNAASREELLKKFLATKRGQ